MKNMKKYIIVPFLSLLMLFNTGCDDYLDVNKNIDSPDYVEEGLFRIINDEMLMGFADTLGNVVIKPQFAFVWPFKDGKAEVTYTGEKKALDDYGEHWTWQSDDWFYIDKNGNKLK